jgi:cytochrome b involved in lipid metabolism
MKKLLLITTLLTPALFLVGCNTKTTTTTDTVMTGTVITGSITGEETTTTTTTTTETTTVDSGAIAAKGSYTMEEVAKNNTPASCWTTIDGIVYDLTAWINQHPGGDKTILKICGIDGTVAFSRKHGSNMKAQEILKEFKIGVLK